VIFAKIIFIQQKGGFIHRPLEAGCNKFLMGLLYFQW